MELKLLNPYGNYGSSRSFDDATRQRCARRLRKLREARGVSRFVLAKAINRTVGTISHYENGRNMPPLSLLQRLAILLAAPNLSFEYFVEPDKDDEEIDNDENAKGQMVANIVCKLHRLNVRQLQHCAGLLEDYWNDLHRAGKL